MQACFNCGSTSHVSIKCTEPQLYTRCSVCENVCFNAARHKNGCPNASFRSTFLKNVSEVIEIVELIQFQFKGVDNVVLKTQRGEKQIGANLLFLSQAQIQVQNINGILRVNGPDRGKQTIGFINRNEKRRVLISLLPNSLMINNHYMISSNGVIKYDRFEEQNAFGFANCLLKAYNNDELFYLRVKWNEMVFKFDVYPDGVILKDPQESYMEKNLKILIEGKDTGKFDDI